MLNSLIFNNKYLLFYRIIIKFAEYKTIICYHENSI